MDVTDTSDTKDDRSPSPAEPASTSVRRGPRRMLRELRGHIARALVPALALAVVAGGTAGAVTVVALSGTVVETSDPAAGDDGEGTPDGSADEPMTGEAATDEAATAAATDDGVDTAADGSDDAAAASDTSAEDAGDVDEEPVLSFKETVARHGRPDYSAILSRMFPGAQWSLNGSAYTGLRWLDGGTAPTRAELDALWPEVAAAIAKERAAQAAREAEAAAAREAELEARRSDPSVQALLDSFDPRTIWGPEPD